MLKISKEIECYDKVMELHPNYPKIWYNLSLGYKQKAKNMFIKMKSLKNPKKNKLKKYDGITDLSHNLIILYEKI